MGVPSFFSLRLTNGGRKHQNVPVRKADKCRKKTACQNAESDPLTSLQWDYSCYKQEQYTTHSFFVLTDV